MTAAIDDFGQLATGLDSPYRRGVAITPSDTVNLADVTRAIYVGGTGTITYVSEGGDTVPLLGNIPVGAVIRVCASRVNSTGTTATNLVALW
jgi:hypothetical protein